MNMKKSFTASLLSLCLLVAAGCASTPGSSSTAPGTRGTAGILPTMENMSGVYTQMGLLAPDGSLPFVGKIAYFGTSSPDSTLLLVTTSFANRSLTFVREGDQFAAPYEVRINLSKDSVPVQAITAAEVVRVGSFREIGRSDESVIFQRFIRLVPGQYRIGVAVRDGGSAKSASQQGTINVPSMKAGSLSTPISVYEARLRLNLDSVPRLLPSPRSAATFGLDSAIVLYLEAYGNSARTPVRVSIANEKNVTLWADTTTLTRRGSLSSGVVSVPVGRAALGISTIWVSRIAGIDTAFTKVFVGFGPEIPLMSYEDLLTRLRFFASSARIRLLRETAPEGRGRAWAAFRQSTDPTPSTPEHEGLQAYFNRIAAADARFRSSGEQGWLSDRGAVYVTLGEPDQVFEQLTSQTTRSVYSPSGRIQVWEYGQYNTRLIFFDSGLGRWQLTQASQNEFASLSLRVQAR